MIFQNGDYLYGTATALLILLVGVIAMKRKKRLLAAFSAFHPILSDGKPRGRQVLAILLLAGAMVLMALALADPRIEDEGAEARRMGIDLVVALDLSKSMLAQEGSKSRLEKALQELNFLSDRAKGDRVGLVGFAGSAELICPLTYDLKSFRSYLDRLDVYRTLGIGSSLGQGLAEAIKTFDKAPGRTRAIILMSDGEDLNPADPPEPVAQRAFDAGIRIYTLMFGAPGGAKVPSPDGGGFIKEPSGMDVVSEPDPEVMQRVASLGKGGFVAAWETAFPMDFLCTEHLLSLKATALEAEPLEQGTPAYQGFVLCALGLLLMDLLVPYRRKVKTLAMIFLMALGGPVLYGKDLEGNEAAREGIRLYRAGDFASAKACFEKASLNLGNHPDLSVNLGLVHLRLGSMEKARSYFEEALGSGGGPWVGAARFGAGIVAYKQAEKLFSEAGSLKGQEQENKLSTALDRLKSARFFFMECLKQEAWPKDASKNLELSYRLEEKARMNLEELRKARIDRKEEKTDEGASPYKTAGVSGTESPDSGLEERLRLEGDGDRKADEPSNGTLEEERAEGFKKTEGLSSVEKDRIFNLLEALERKRIALERARAEALWQREKGRDW